MTTLSGMPQRKKILYSGFIAWFISLASALNVYLLAMDGDWSRFDIGVLLTAFLTSIISGLKDLMAFLAESPRSADAPVVVAEPASPIDYDDFTVEPAGIDMQRFRTEIKADEGYRDHIYNDSEGNPTAGYGHLLTPSDPEHGQPLGTKVSESRINEWFSSDITQAIADARAVVKDFDSHPQNVKHALANMAFNMGRTRLSGFKNTLALIDARRYAEASTEALNSKWADQVGSRSKRVSAMMASGVPTAVLA